MMNSDFNQLKLKAIVDAFTIPVTVVAQATGVSRPYVARILSERDNFGGSPQFWSSLERNLGKIIEQRHGQVFEVPAQEINQVLAVNGLAR